MPKVKWSLDTDEPDELEVGGFYDGEVPPQGVYQVVLKRLSLKENRNGDDMFSGLLEIREPKGSPKAKYNGYGFWFNQNVTKQGAPFLKNFLVHGLGVTWKDFLTKTVTEDDDRPTKVVKIGKVTIEDNEIEMRVSARRGKDRDSNPQLENPRFLPPRDEDEDEDWEKTENDSADSDSDEDDDDAPF